MGTHDMCAVLKFQFFKPGDYADGVRGGGEGRNRGEEGGVAFPLEN